jgi:hypothetical protein
VAVLGGGIGAGSNLFTRVGAIAYAGGVVLFSSQIVRIALGGTK